MGINQSIKEQSFISSSVVTLNYYQTHKQDEHDDVKFHLGKVLYNEPGIDKFISTSSLDIATPEECRHKLISHALKYRHNNISQYELKQLKSGYFYCHAMMTKPVNQKD